MGVFQLFEGCEGAETEGVATGGFAGGGGEGVYPLSI